MSCLQFGQFWSVAVENRRTSEVYLEGELERGIVPAQSVWTHGGRDGADGCLLLLHKMNLELLQRCESLLQLFTVHG